MKIKLLLTSLGILWTISSNVYADDFLLDVDLFENVIIDVDEKQPLLDEIGRLNGTLKMSGSIFVNGQSVDLYSFNDVNYVYLDYEFGTMEIKEGIISSAQPDKLTFTLAENKINVGLYETYTLHGSSGVFIPLNSLKGLYTVTNNSIIDDKNSISNLISISDNTITNLTEKLLSITYQDEDLQVWEIDNFYKNYQSLDGEITVLSIEHEGNIIYNFDQAYQNEQQQIIKNNTNYIKSEVEKRVVPPEIPVEDLFPPSIIIGTMKYATNGFYKGEKVTVQRAHDGEAYYIETKTGLVKVPWNSVSIPRDPATQYERATNEQIENYINRTGLKSKTKYLVWTDLYRQRTYIFQNIDNRWEIIKDFLCSTGKNITPTPRGTYQLLAKVPYFGVDKGYMCKDASQFMGDYLYHSILFDKTGTYLLEGRGILGVRASQGCVRFAPEECKWFYETLPVGTAVWIN